MNKDTIMLEVDGKFHAYVLSTAIRARIEDLRLNPDATISNSDVPMEVNTSAEIYVLNELGALLSERINEKAAEERKRKERQKQRKSRKQSDAYRSHILSEDG